MEKDTIGAIVTVLLAIVGVAILAELVSKGANTPNVFTAFGDAISGMLCTALTPLGVQCKGQEQVTSTWHPVRAAQ